MENVETADVWTVSTFQFYKGSGRAARIDRQKKKLPIWRSWVGYYKKIPDPP